jgi:hypothetical protein
MQQWLEPLAGACCSRVHDALGNALMVEVGDLLAQDEVFQHDMAAVAPAGAVVFVETLNRAAPTADETSSRDMEVSGRSLLAGV